MRIFNRLRNMLFVHWADPPGPPKPKNFPNNQMLVKYRRMMIRLESTDWKEIRNEPRD